MPRLRSSSPTPRSVWLALACGVLSCDAARDATPRVGIATQLVAPRSVLAHATKLTLAVIEGDVSCEPSTGEVVFPNGPAAAKQLASAELGASGCADGEAFCGQITVERSATPRVFSAVAADATDTTVALGCATTTLDRETASVAITMVRYLAPPVCGDGVLQPTEQCEAESGSICDDECQTKEILLSVGSQANGTYTGTSGDKSQPFFLWPSQGGANAPFVAFFTDRATGQSNNRDVGLRTMSADLTPVTTPPALAAASIFLPNGTGFPPKPAPFQQSAPAAASMQGTTYVVFQDDDSVSPNGLDIHLRSMDASFVAQQGTTPIGVNGPDGNGEANIQQAPAIAAGPEGRLFIAWEDAAQGKIVGRTFTPPDTLGSQNDISTGNGNVHVALAATSTGWVAVWQSGTTIKLRTINASGTPEGSEQTVSEGGAVAEAPSVATLSDGRFAVAFSANDDVFVQRYDARGTKVAGDQAASVNDVVKDGAQNTAVIAATPAASGSYAVAWLDAASGHVRARMLGGSTGYLFNNVNGLSTEFQASRAEQRARKTPVVVSGGAGPFVAIGWEDTSKPFAGIIVRRFPLPTE